MCTWLLDNDLIGQLFGDSIHLEVLKNCTSILVFLAINKELSTDMIKLVYQSSIEQHESTRTVIWNMLIETIKVVLIITTNARYSILIVLNYCIL